MFGSLDFFAYLCIVKIDRGKGKTLKYNLRATQTEIVKKCLKKGGG